MDYRHHWQDVFIGSLLGTFCSYFSYRQYYPHLGSDDSHLPFSPRIKREEEETLPIHNRRSSSSGQGHEYPPVARVGNNPSGTLSAPKLTRRYTDEPAEYEMDGTVHKAGPPQRNDSHQVWKDGEFAARPEESPAAPSGHAVMP